MTTWRCPACQLSINHSPHELTPTPGIHYRCHVCRLELVASPDGNGLTVAPVDQHDDPPRKQRKIR